MANKNPTVVIVGKPNVGKSSLFNRILQTKKAIVENTPGVTRDRIYGKGSWLETPFNIIDTGGLTNDKSDLQKQIQIQVNTALAEADLILFLCSFKDGLTIFEQTLAQKLHRINKPTLLVVNKFDAIKAADMDLKYDFLSLGFQEPAFVSAIHGIGIGDLLDEIIAHLPANPSTATDEKVIKFCLIGQPNVGKSSLTNAILQENRSIISAIPGTTTDAIDSEFKYHDQTYIIIDTAGIRKKGKIQANTEKYSYMRTTEAIERSDIVLFMIDGSVGLQEQDLRVAGLGKENRKPVIIVVNKWDIVEKDQYTMDQQKKDIKERIKYLNYALVVFISAKENLRINKLLETIQLVWKNMNLRISTNLLNNVLNKAQLLNQPPNFNGGRLKIYYGTQIDCAPPTFVIKVNNASYLHFSYERFLLNQIYENFGFTGTNIKLLFRSKKEERI